MKAFGGVSVATLLVIILWLRLLVPFQGLGLGTELQHRHHSSGIGKLTVDVPYCGEVYIAEHQAAEMSWQRPGWDGTAS